MTIKAITLYQPWATLMAIGAKRIETRGWSTHYRGPLAIHASKTFPAEYWNLCCLQPFVGVLLRAGYHNPDQLPLGKVLCLLRLSSIIPTDLLTSEIGRLDPLEREFGTYAPGRFGWITEHILGFDPPVPAIGRQQLWNWTPTPEVEEQISQTILLQSGL